MNLQGSTTSRSVELTASSWVARMLAIIVLITLIVVGFIIAIPIVIALLALGLVLFFYFKIKMFFRRAHDPNGPLDRRRNVRVMDRDA
jgi:fatty acid desaturase